LKLSDDAIVRTSARAVPSLGLGRCVHGIVSAEGARLKRKLSRGRAREGVGNTAVACIQVRLSAVAIVEAAALLASQELRGHSHRGA